MSGHNRWAKVKHVKAKTDAIKGRLFSRLIKEIVVAARQGGGNPETNARLRTVIQKAREANMAQDTVRNAIKRGTGELEGVSYEEMTYEAYGPGGTALLIDVLTDNKNRTAAEMRYVLSRNHGNLAAAGSVAWKFNKKAYFCVDKSKVNEDTLIEIALEAGAEDVKTNENDYEIFGPPESFESIKAALEKANIEHEGEITMHPTDLVKLEGEDAKKMLKLMEALEEHDDVQHVYANFDIDDKLMDSEIN